MEGGQVPPTPMNKNTLTSTHPIVINDWWIKASVLDDQILVVLVNKNTLTTYCEMFYNEELAHSFIERVLYDD